MLGSDGESASANAAVLAGDHEGSEADPPGPAGVNLLL